MLGCVIYTLAYFVHPFVDSNAIGIASGVYRFPRYPDETQYQVSDKIKDLIRNFLTPNPIYRPGVQDALKIVNSWFTISSIPLNVYFKGFREKPSAGRKKRELNKRSCRF
jgi:AP2-associated kinase